MIEPNLLLRARHKENCVTTSQFRREDLILERELHSCKWFDYRFISPSEATAIFRKTYQEVYRWKYSHNFDTEESKRKFGTRAGAPEEHRGEFTAFWRARQFADQLGMPYEIFLDAAFDALLTADRKRLPYINQLYGKYAERIAASAWDRWQEHCGSRLMFSPLPHYKTGSFVGLAAQVAHQDWVLEQLKTRSDGAIGQACFVLRIVPEERAKLAFGEVRLENGRAHVADEVPEAYEAYTLRQILPSCAMLPGVLDPSSPECSTCQLARFCAGAEAAVLRKVIADTGVADPEGVRRRRQGAVRTAKCRLKAKHAAEAKSRAGKPL
jgi:hypothetical protein